MSKKVALVALGVAIAAGAGGKLYFDNKAATIFDEKVAEITKENPNVDIKASSVSMNPLDSVVTLKDISIADKVDKSTPPVKIKELSFTAIDESKGIPNVASYSASGIALDLADMKYKDQDQEVIMKHMAGSDNIIDLSSYGKSVVNEKSNSMALSSGFGIENFGNVDVSFDLGGIYKDIQESIISDNFDAIDKNPMQLLGKASVNDLSISFSSNNFKSLVLAATKGKATEKELFAELDKSIERAKKDKEAAPLIKHLVLIKSALEQDKDFVFEIKVGSEISQKTVMEAMMSGKQNSPDQLFSAFGVEVTSKLK